MKNKIVVFILLAVFTLQSNAYVNLLLKATYNYSKISHHSMVFTKLEIKELSKLTSKELGKKLGKLKLPKEVLEDTFIRIAIHKEIINRKAAQGLFTRLSGTPGFHTTLKKIIGNNLSGTKGHLNELQIADNASVAGFKVLGIGVKFKDPDKKALTDIDVVLKKGGRTFIVEAKAYDKAYINKINYKEDLNTLVNYKKQHKNSDIVPIFSFNAPYNSTYFKSLKNEAKKRNVELIFGKPYEQIEQIKALNKIL